MGLGNTCSLSIQGSGLGETRIGKATRCKPAEGDFGPRTLGIAWPVVHVPHPVPAAVSSELLGFPPDSIYQLLYFSPRRAFFVSFCLVVVVVVVTCEDEKRPKCGRRCRCAVTWREGFSGGWAAPVISFVRRFSCKSLIEFTISRYSLATTGILLSSCKGSKSGFTSGFQM